MEGADPLLRFRPEFPTLSASTSLISNSLGAIDEAFEAIDEILPWRAWSRWTSRPSLVT